MALIRMLVFNDRTSEDPIWEPAEIINTYHSNGDLLATVRWPDGTITTGHFVDLMQEIPKPRER